MVELSLSMEQTWHEIYLRVCAALRYNGVVDLHFKTMSRHFICTQTVLQQRSKKTKVHKKVKCMAPSHYAPDLNSDNTRVFPPTCSVFVTLVQLLF